MAGRRRLVCLCGFASPANPEPTWLRAGRQTLGSGARRMARVACGMSVVASRGGDGEARGGGLAVASLVLGVLGVLTGLVVLGGFLGAVGLALGVWHRRRCGSRPRMAGLGMGLSVVAILLASVALTVVVSLSNQMRSAGNRPRPPVFGALGKAAADFEVTTLSGDVVRVRDFRGKRVALNFWASWLPESARQVPDWVRLRKEVPEEDLAILAITGEERAAVEAFLTGWEINYPVARSARGVLPEPYSQIERLPTTFFLDAAGVIDHVMVGSRGYAELKARALGTKPQAPTGAGGGQAGR